MDRILEGRTAQAGLTVATDRRSRVDPELLPALDVIPDFDPLSAANLAEFRSTVGDVPAPDPTVPVKVERVEISPTATALLYLPNWSDAAPAKDRGLPAMINIHGGGFVMGTAAREDAQMRMLCAQHGLAILSIDYRLAPEHPFPAALDDCAAGLDWLLAKGESIGVNRACIGVRGVSAGGGLAAGLALRLRDAGALPLAWLWLLYPMLDDRTRSSVTAGRCVWTANANRFGWSSYLGAEPGGPDVSPYAAPARAASLGGLPRTFLATGSIDLFAHEDIAFANRLLADGVETELHVYPGAYHGFNLVAGSAVAERYRSDADAALERFLHACL